MGLYEELSTNNYYFGFRINKLIKDESLEKRVNEIKGFIVSPAKLFSQKITFPYWI